MRMISGCRTWIVAAPDDRELADPAAAGVGAIVGLFIGFAVMPWRA
jgi:hypothetical protein